MRAVAVLFGWILVAWAVAGDDPRLLAQDYPADWQRSVVKLKVPVSRMVEGRRHTFTEDCTGTIVSTAPPRILSAWHCFDGYDDLSRPPAMLLDGVWEETRLIASGGSMAADWALLSFPPDLLAGRSLAALPIAIGPLLPGSTLILAGFSGDAALGEEGQMLTYDPSCTVGLVERHRAASNCLAYRGASGGPALQWVDGQMAVAGVLSGKNAEGTRFLVPARMFASAVR